MTSSNENIFRVTGPLCGEFTGYNWVNNRDAGDLRRHGTHYDVIVMGRASFIHEILKIRVAFIALNRISIWIWTWTKALYPVA